MTDIKHTPGPWEYRSRELDDWGIVRADGFVICQARDKKSMSDVVQSKHRADGTDPYEANARLISAAPDMYEALVAAEKAIDAYIDACGEIVIEETEYGKSDLDAVSAYLKCTKALEKARGVIRRANEL